MRIHGISPRELKGPFFAFFRPKSRNVEKRKVSQCDDFRSVLELFFTNVKGLQFDPMVHWVQLSELDLNPLSAPLFTCVHQFYRRWKPTTKTQHNTFEVPVKVLGHPTSKVHLWDIALLDHKNNVRKALEFD